VVNLLERELGRVEAPDELWHRVQTGRKIPARRPMPVALAVAAILLGAVWLTGQGQRPEPVRVQPVGSCSLCHL